MNNEDKEYIEQFSKSLDDVKKTIVEQFSDNNIKDFESKLKLDLRGINSDYAKDVVAKLDDCSNAITEPVYVGMLGRYSHGKSTLVNCLFSLDENTKLPEGGGIVTTKVTMVAFDKNVSRPEAYKHFRGEENESERFLDYHDFKDAAKDRDDDNSNIAYLEAKIPVDEKVVGLKTNFFQHNIQLVDMPGLGGAYSSDYVTKDYLSICDLVIVTIKITEIEVASKYVDELLKEIRCSKIVVLTFFDEETCRSDNYFSKYDGDKMMENVLEDAKEQIKKHFKNLGNINDIIAVNNSDPQLIDQVRCRILDKILVQTYGPKKMRKKTPEVMQRKTEELKNELVDLRQKSEKLRKVLESLVEKTVGKDDDKNVDIRNVFDSPSVKEQISKRKKYIKDEISKFESEHTREINSLREIDEAEGVCKTISEEQTELNVALNDRFSDYVSSLKDAANDYISRMNISDKNKNDFKEQVKNALSEFNDVFNAFEIDLSGVRDVIPSKAGSWLSNIITRIFRSSKSNIEKTKETRDSLKKKFHVAIGIFEKKVFDRIEEVDSTINGNFKGINLNDINGNIRKLRDISSRVSEKVIELAEKIDDFKSKF